MKDIDKELVVFVEKELTLKLLGTYVMDNRYRNLFGHREQLFDVVASIAKSYAEDKVKEFAEWLADAPEGINPFVIHKGKWIQACGNSTSWTTKQLWEKFRSGNINTI